MQLKFRPHNSEDVHFIYSSWLQSFREINVLKVKSKEPLGETLEFKTGPALWDKEVYYKRQRQLIDTILAKSNVLICCNPEDEGQIYGYVVYRDYSPDIRIISYLYVKHPFRKLGFAGRLFGELGACHVATHGGCSTKKLITRAGLIYDPFFEYDGTTL